MKDETTYSPQELIAAIRDGDREAFTVFYNGYGDSIVGFLTKILGNVEEAKDVTQETFISLWENRAKLNPHTSLKSYVGAMAKHHAVDMIRVKKRRSERSDGLIMSRNPSADFADDPLIDRETRLLLKDVLRRMPAQRRRVYEMSREEELSYNEIADQLGISHNTVKFHMQAALSDIRSALSAFLLLLFLD